MIDQFFEIEGHPDVSAIGDCMAMPNPTGEGYCPPTAQHATRQAKVLAHNINAKLFGGEKKRFTFKGLGTMGSLGYHNAVALLFNRIPVSGFFAWFLWRSVYWWKMPGFDRKIKVGLAWALDVLIPPETVQLKMSGGNAISQVHFEPGEVVFYQGDLGDSLYIILEGEADVVIESDENGRHEEKVVATLKEGEYFGEMALLEPADQKRHHPLQKGHEPVGPPARRLPGPRGEPPRTPRRLRGSHAATHRHGCRKTRTRRSRQELVSAGWSPSAVESCRRICR